jgi:hypothetical protein
MIGLKADLWRQSKLSKKPNRLWQEAAVKWLDEVRDKHKRSMDNAKVQLKWLNPYLRHKKLSDIDRNLLDDIAKKKEEKVATVTVNRMLEIVRAILNKAANDWEWIEKAPKVPIRYEGGARERWLSKEEVEQLLKELPFI